MVKFLSRDALRDILAFFREAGVDEPLDETPSNRLLSAARLAQKVAPPTTSPAPPPAVPAMPRAVSDKPAADPAAPSAEDHERFAFVPDRPVTPTAAVPDEGQVLLARELARKARTLDELRDHMSAFEGCNLRYTAKSLVFADGNPEADLMLVGEAPGRDEDIEGLPFVGRSGQLLDRMLAAIGRDRTSAYIANVIPWRPPGNRTPTPQETEICRPFIERQIELANPKVLVTLGGPSAKVLLRTTDGVLRLRGGWKAHVTEGGVAVPTMPTLHPAYLLRTPAHKRLAWRDLLEVKAKLRELAAGS
ncbi:uracil-DNA glycosylase [Arvimicrobium flavum]|uniref:uracil-DNA glycosylase n=1 Tax=Arvimicrobium flavum TaxID=3393320 RepID=UPI00237A8C08|nr:uracil-DNA glycosylase [Mesorhizobium shangrilense]